MAAFISRHLTLPTIPATVGAIVAPAGAVLAGLAAAALCLLLPQATLEDWVWRSGLPSLLAAAAPPLGTTARAGLAIAGAVLVGAVAWSALFLLFGPGGLLAPRVAVGGEADGVPVLRRADAHPDAPARRPMSASDLGAPLPPPSEPVAVAPVPPPPPPPPVVQPLPADLDVPLAAFHPGAILPVPREPLRPVPPLRTSPPLGAGERIATVELPRSAAESAASPSIESLLKRLERGARRPIRA